MAKTHAIEIRRSKADPLALNIEAGRSIVIIGANGAGKTRLGAHIEDQIPFQNVHRLAAQKSLALNDEVALTTLERAEKALRLGHANASPGNKDNRWGQKPATRFLNDVDALLQRLFAEHGRTAIDFAALAETDRTAPVPRSALRQLKDIWDALLPHRVLKPREASVEILTEKDAEAGYPGSDLSDGERAIFYFLGQCLVADRDMVIIVDEPEGHVHKAVLGALWDAIEKARPDCGFVYITHDLDFAMNRPAAARYYIRSYTHKPQAWDIAEVPKETGLPEHVVAEIVGSRRPILFVEGDRGSIDLTLYRHHYAGFTIVPIGGCGDVIRSVATYKNSGELHWVDAMGLIDADHRSPDYEASLHEKRVYLLPVAEVENLLLLPDVFMALAEASDLIPMERLTMLTEKVLKIATRDVDGVCARYTARQLDEKLKRVANAANDLATLEASYRKELAGIDPATIFNEFKVIFEKAIQDRDLEAVLKLFDNKTLVSVVTGTLNLKDDAKTFMGRVERILGSKEKRGQKLREALAKYLPAIPVPSSAGKGTQAAASASSAAAPAPAAS